MLSDTWVFFRIGLDSFYQDLIIVFTSILLVCVENLTNGEIKPFFTPTQSSAMRVRNDHLLLLKLC